MRERVCVCVFMSDNAISERTGFFFVCGQILNAPRVPIVIR